MKRVPFSAAALAAVVILVVSIMASGPRSAPLSAQSPQSTPGGATGDARFAKVTALVASELLARGPEEDLIHIYFRRLRLSEKQFFNRMSFRQLGSSKRDNLQLPRGEYP